MRYRAKTVIPRNKCVWSQLFKSELLVALALISAGLGFLGLRLIFTVAQQESSRIGIYEKFTSPGNASVPRTSGELANHSNLTTSTAGRPSNTFREGGLVTSVTGAAALPVQPSTTAITQVEVTGIRAQQGTGLLNHVEAWIQEQRSVTGHRTQRPEMWLTVPHSQDKHPGAAPGPGPTCPSAREDMPPAGRLRVVSDPTLESDVEIVADKLVLSNYPNDHLPPPQMTSSEKFPEFCNSLARVSDSWRRVCPQGSMAEHGWGSCDVRQLVIKVNCAYLDTDPLIPCMAYDRTRTFPVHGNHPARTKFQPLKWPPTKIQEFDALGHAVAVYPHPKGGAAHFFNQLPRLFMILNAIPPDVPVLVPKHSASDKIVDILVNRGWLKDRSRIIDWDKSTVYYANTLYFVGEMGRGNATSMKWDSLGVEKCSWALALPRSTMQQSFQVRGAPRRPKPMILVVHRSDASFQRRMIDNHAAVMTSIRDMLPECEILEFIGSQHSMDATIDMFNAADVVVAPHGAALSFACFMQPDKAIVEIGYNEYGKGKGMPFPVTFFYAIALSVGARYYLSMAQGHYQGRLQADPDDIAILTKWAFGNVTAARNLTAASPR